VTPGAPAVDVRTVSDSSVLDDLGEVLAHAFAFEAARASAWFDRAGIDQLRVAHDARGEVVGGLVRIPMGQWFGGRPVPLTGLAGVAVRADRRRQGVASGLLRATLHELREQGVALSGLYASNQSLYRAAGWEHAANRFHGRIRPRDLPPGAPASPVELGRPEHQTEVAALYREQAAHQAGFLDRGPYLWGRILRPFDGSTVHRALLRTPEGVLEAWLAYRLERLPDATQRLEVIDAVSRSPEGWSRLWSHLADLSTMVAEITLVTAPTDPLHLALSHPMAMSLHQPYLLRIVEPRAALLARGYARGQVERVVMRLVDPVFGDDTLTIDVEAGHAEVRSGGDPTAHVHVRGLAAMFAGHLSPHEAQAAGLVEAGPRSLAALQALFAGPSPWMRDFF
jgi:predicted acetyltransferase